MLTAGVDIGSLATKAVVLKRGGGRLIGAACLPSGSAPADAGREALEQALSEADLPMGELAATVATGYGRESVPVADGTVTEITCAARGAHLLEPGARTVVDIGGQDSKVIRVDADGYPLDFALNDRCAAGTGRFVEVMAQALDTSVEDLQALAASADQPAPITNTCTVFAESEVVGLLAGGERPADVAAGLCRAIAQRTALLVHQVGVDPLLMLIGGVGLNREIARELRRVLDVELMVPERPQLVVAMGAAVVAAERVQAANG